MSSLDELGRRDWARWQPPPRLTVAEWADQERRLPAESSAEPGTWRTDRTPYLREPMSIIKNRSIETVVLISSSQIGKTELLLNIIGYHMHLDPAPIMLIEPTLEMGSALSKDRVTPMIRSTPGLRGLVGPAGGRAASATIFHKQFPGGHLTISGANSPASLASRPIRILLADEVDRWPSSVGDEGDPLTIAIKRTTTFRRRKIVIVSTPTVKDASRIEDWWKISDRRRFHTPCPRCGHKFVLVWAHVRWDERDPSTAHIECPHCHGRVEDSERQGMIATGEWKAEAPFAGIAGFHVWEIFSPWRSLRDQVAEFLVARRSLETRQVWVNTSLGELWEIPGDRIEPSSLLLRREKYAAELPAGVQILTCGVDTQDDRLEALVMGWGPGEESWAIERVPLPGDPARPDAWHELDALLTRDWSNAGGGTMRVQCTLIDAGGHRTQAVYGAVIPRQVRHVFASFGRAGGENGLLVSPPKAIRPGSRIAGNVLRRIVDVDQVKALIYARLNVTDPGPEYVHFPMSVGETFFDELTAEKLVTRRNKYGVPTKTWEQIRERNESLDCFVLALAALRIIAPNPQRFAALAAQIAVASAEAGKRLEQAAAQDAVPTRRVSRSSYLGG